MIKLYSADGLIEKAEIKKFNYNGEFMGASFITATINSPTPLNFEIGDYCIFRGEKFTLNYEAAKKKQASIGTYGEAFIYDNIKFNSLSDELTGIEFLDIVPKDNNIHYTSKPDFSFYASSVQDLIDRIQANLDLEFTGERKWTINMDVSVESVGKNITISAGTTLWNAVTLFNTEFGLNFIIRNRTITVGTAGTDVGRVFSYGKGNGLYDIEQHTNQDAKIITRLRAYGNTRNLPRKYYNSLLKPDGTSYIEASADILNLMLPSFPYDNSDPRLVYVESGNISKYGVKYGSVYFDGSDELLGDIYPSIEGMTAQQLSDAGIIVGLPASDNGKLDEVLGADNPTDDGLIPDEPNTIDGQFKLYLKDLGFDLTEKDENGDYKYQIAGQPVQIAMKSGMNESRTFDVVEGGITKDTSLGYTRYVLECNRFEDDSIHGGTAFPNNNYKINAGDRFVILGIEMPEVYIKAASQRLLTAAQDYLSQNDETKYTYTPTIDNIFMANHPELSENIKEGDILSFSDDDLQIDASVIIQSLKIEFDLSSSAIPKYTVTLNNEKVASTIDKMQNTINSLVSNQTGITLNQVKSLINTIGSSLFISKNFNDTAKGLIKFIRGLDIGEYSSGALGGGGTFRMNEQGQSYVEVDNLYVRMQAIFRELIIERLSHIGGSLVLSPARIQCIKVEEYPNYFRCYFDTGDSGEVVNNFVADDQARCQVFTGSSIKYYWRLVEGVGSDYIDLSKTDFDGTDIPAEGDDIVQLGNRTDVSRQNAQILSSFGEDAPSYKQYQGINSYSLEGKETNVLSSKGNVFSGKVTIKEGSTGWENLVGLPDAFQSLSTGAVNLIRNSGFTGDYASKRLDENTILNSDTNLFSEALGYWLGSGTVNEDADSYSGYSVTLLDETLSQEVPTIFTENYALSFKAKGEFIDTNTSGVAHHFDLTEDYKSYTVKLEAGDSKIFSISGRCTVCELQLERGTIKSDYNFSPLDNDKSLAEFEATRFISDAIHNGETTILGGLILSSLINVGNYINGEMKEVTAGMSGMYNEDRDVAFWAGGDLFKALATSLDPYTTDPEKIANFVVTHGGRLIANEAIIRGHITATSGTIGGFEISEDRLSSVKKDANGNPFINLDGVDGSGWLAGGNLLWDAIGQLFMQGKFESNKDGNRIVIDPETRSLRMISRYGQEVSRLSFFEEATGSDTYLHPNLRFNYMYNNVGIASMLISGYDIMTYMGESIARLSADQISINNNDTACFSAYVGDSNLNFNLKGLPINKNDLIEGSVYIKHGDYGEKYLCLK